MSYGYFDLYTCSGLFVYPYSSSIKWADAWKTKNSDYPPIEDSVQREHQYSLMSLSPRAVRNYYDQTARVRRLIFAGHM